MILATKFKPDADEPFQIAVDAGMRAAELWTGPDVLDNWRAAAERARRFELQYVLHFPTRRDLTDAQLCSFVELSRAVDSRVAVIHRAEMQKYGAAVAALDPSLELAVENGHLSPAEFAAWEAANPRLTLDAEHVWLFTHRESTYDAAVRAVDEFLQRNDSKLRHVHLPGYDGTSAEHRPMYYAPQFVSAVLSLLRDAGYTGLVVSEVNLEFQTFEHLRRDVEFFESWRQDDAKRPQRYLRG